MEIKITRQKNDYIIQHDIAIWRYGLSKGYLGNNTRAIGAIVAGPILLLVKIGNMLLSKESFWSFDTAIAVIMILYALFIFYNNYATKKKFFEQSKEQYEAYSKNNNVTEIVLTEQLYKYKDFESYAELKWSLFTKIEQNKNYFFMFLDKRKPSVIVLDKNEFTENQLKEFSDFLGSVNKTSA
jgi:hypothetical protein